MKKQIIEALSTRFTGVSDTILGRIADKLAKTIKEESEIKDAVEAVTFQQVLESYGDSRATEAQQTAIKNYETKYGLKDGKAAAAANGGNGSGNGDGDNGKQGADTDPQLKALMDKLTAMEARLADVDKKNLTDARKAKLASIVEKLPEKFRAPYLRMDVSSLSDEDFNSQMETITTEVDGIASEVKAKGAVFGRPFQQGSRVDSKEEVPQSVLEVLDAEAKKGEEGQQNF